MSNGHFPSGLTQYLLDLDSITNPKIYYIKTQMKLSNFNEQGVGWPVCRIQNLPQ